MEDYTQAAKRAIEARARQAREHPARIGRLAHEEAQRRAVQARKEEATAKLSAAIESFWSAQAKRDFPGVIPVVTGKGLFGHEKTTPGVLLYYHDSPGNPEVGVAAVESNYYLLTNGEIFCSTVSSWNCGSSHSEWATPAADFARSDPDQADKIVVILTERTPQS